MSAGFRPDLVLGQGARGLARPSEALSQRVQLVLSTRPGDLGWKPEFGCDLAQLVGRPASNVTRVLAEQSITTALRTWIPEVSVRSCRVAARTLPSPAWSPHGPVERALVPLGVQATLTVDLVLDAEQGPAALSLEVEP